MSYNTDNNMYEGYIYCIENIDSRKRYIGQTSSTIDKRWIQHKCSSSKAYPKYYIHKAIKKYGVDKFQIYEISKISCISKSDLKYHLDYLENFYIAQFCTFENEFGYNLTKGGDSSSNLVKNAVCQYDLCGNLLKEWDSLQGAAEYCNVDKASIWAACNGITQVCNGYVWRYKGDLFDKFPLGKHAKNREKHLSNVKQYDFSGNFIRVYTKDELCKMFCSSGVYDIYKVCDGNKPYYKDFVWRYEHDEFDKYKIQISITNKSKLKDEKKRKTTNSGRFQSRKVNCYDINNNFIKTYNSITEAGNAVGLKNSYNITNVCRYKRNFAGGYRWYYADDINQPDKTKIIATI